ncbi:MAG: MarR family winged helix-turn-helix transcriptional regulator [Actinomycetota bacterium]
MERNLFVFALLDSSAKLTRRLDRSLSNIKGISFTEYQLLAALRGCPDGSATRVELADRIGRTPSGVTRALKPMERLGFVATVKDERDARRSLATLTPAGHELVADAEGVVDDTLDGLSAIDALRPSEHERFLRLLGELANG